MTLATILYSAEQIDARYQPSLNAAFAQIARESGTEPHVLTPNGGARTKAQCNALGTSWTVSDHWEGAGAERNRAAVDIDNQRDLRNKLGSARFEAILAAHGWHNIDVSGRPFGKEPWHFANHATTPAGGGITPIESETPDMFRLVHISGKAYMVGPTGLRTPILADPTNYHLNLCKRVLASVDASDPMLAPELDIVASYQAKVSPAGGAAPAAGTLTIELTGKATPAK